MMIDISQDTESVFERASTLASVEQQRRGFIPSASERNDIDETTSQLSSVLPGIDAEIERLHALRERVRTQLDINNSIIAPVRRLPVEVTTQFPPHI